MFSAVSSGSSRVSLSCSGVVLGSWASAIPKRASWVFTRFRVSGICGLGVGPFGPKLRYSAPFFKAQPLVF